MLLEPVVQEFIRLAEIDSPPRQERALADYLLARCAELGVQLSEDDTGKEIGGNAGNLYGFLPGDEREPLLLCAHMDTVRSNHGLKVVIEDGKLCSQGRRHILGADDKVGIAAILEVLRRCQESRHAHPPIEVLFTIAEETGLLGAKSVDITRLHSKHGLVLDAGGRVGTVVKRSPVHYEFLIKVHGRAAHAGNSPETGINAIQIAAQIVGAIKLGRIDEYTTANIGKITGGAAINIVPDYAELTGEVRSHRPERATEYLESLSAVAKRIAAEYGGQGEVEATQSFPAMQLDEGSRIAVATRDAAAKIGLRYELVTKGGGSDANILNSRGLTCANLGIGCYLEHSNEEYVAVADLEKLVEYLMAICEVW